MTPLEAWTVRSPPALSLTLTAGTVAPFTSVASPSITSILCFFIRKATPLFIVAATPRERWMMASKSNAAPVAERPYSLRWDRLSNFSPLLSRALVGMQPQLRQMPPSSARSTMAVFRPSWLARMAAT